MYLNIAPNFLHYFVSELLHWPFLITLNWESKPNFQSLKRKDVSSFVRKR